MLLQAKSDHQSGRRDGRCSKSTGDTYAGEHFHFESRKTCPACSCAHAPKLSGSWLIICRMLSVVCTTAGHHHASYRLNNDNAACSTGGRSSTTMLWRIVWRCWLYAGCNFPYVARRRGEWASLHLGTAQPCMRTCSAMGTSHASWTVHMPRATRHTSLHSFFAASFTG